MANFKSILNGKIVILGIGNVLRGDDGIGPALIERLNGRVKALCIDAGVSPENYADKITGCQADTILLADAVHMGLAPGEYRILSGAEILKSGFTTHDISPKLFMDYIAQKTKAAVYMLGIEPQKTALGDDMSEAVLSSLDKITQLIAEALNA